MVETNIDDMNPEIFGYLMERLFGEGALDVCSYARHDEKEPSGNQVEVMCPPENRRDISRCLLTETSTIGVRYHLVHGHTLKRSISTVTTCYGEIQVKCTTGSGRTQAVCPGI